MDLSLRPPPSTLGPGSTVWAYLRDSGGSSQDRSIEQQQEIIEEYCHEHQLVLAHPPFKDIHKSGSSTTARDDFNEMVSSSASEHLRPKGLLIWNFARFARDVDDSQIYKGILRKRGIIIHSLTDQIPEGPYSNVIETLVHVSDEQKRREAALGAWRGLRHIVKQGAMPGNPPKGFKREPLTVTSEQGVERQVHRWVPDPIYRSRIRKAFEMRAARHPLSEISKTTRLYRSLNSYRSFFSNKLYIGILEFGSLTIDDYCAPLIPRKLWDAVQRVQARYAQKAHVQANSPDHPRRLSSTYILSGFIECARCHSPLFGHTSPQRNGHSQQGYRCTRRARRRDCDLPRIPAHSLEDAIIDSVRDTFLQPDYFLHLLAADKHKNEAAAEWTIEQRKILEHDLMNLRRQISNLTSAIADAGHSASMLKRLNLLEMDETDFRQRLAELKPPPQISDVDPARLKKGLLQLRERLRKSPPEIQRQLLHAFIEKIIVDRIGKQIFGSITFYLPPDLISPGQPPPSSSPTDYGPSLPGDPTVSISTSPMGAPRYKHILPFDLAIHYSSRGWHISKA